MNARISLTAIACTLFCASANAANVLVNPGFETGTLNPWFADSGAPTVSNVEAHTGAFSASAFGSDSFRQNFAPVATSDITEVSLWAKRPPFPFDQYTFYYSDAPSFSNVIFGAGGDWEFFNITSQLTAGAHLTGFSIFGTSPGPAFLDDFVINVVPEPSSALLATVAIAGATIHRRRKVA